MSIKEKQVMLSEYYEPHFWSILRLWIMSFSELERRLKIQEDKIREANNSETKVVNAWKKYQDILYVLWKKEKGQDRRKRCETDYVCEVCQTREVIMIVGRPVSIKVGDEWKLTCEHCMRRCWKCYNNRAIKFCKACGVRLCMNCLCADISLIEMGKCPSCERLLSLYNLGRW